MHDVPTKSSPEYPGRLRLDAQGTSRGGANIQEIVHRLELWGVNHLYVIGGNGGNAVSHRGQATLDLARKSRHGLTLYSISPSLIKFTGLLDTDGHC